MESAEVALDGMKEQIDLQKLYDLIIEVQTCFFAENFFIKDWKLDQIVKTEDDEYKIVDLGNICSLDELDEKCEYGLLVPPECFKTIHWNHGFSQDKSLKKVFYGKWL